MRKRSNQIVRLSRRLKNDPLAVAHRLGLAEYARRRQFNEARRYTVAHGLEPLVMASLGDGEFPSTAVASKLIDAHRLHTLVRGRRPRQVLEFGCGVSTLWMADALLRNEQDGGGPGRLHVVETAGEWAETVRRRLTPPQAEIVDFTVSPCSLRRRGFTLCHEYDQLPDVVPDFLYLDGPAPSETRGEVRGLTTRSRTVVCSDPLLYESTWGTGFMMLIDGREANADFLRSRLTRRYRYRRSRTHQYATFELIHASDVPNSRRGEYDVSWCRPRGVAAEEA